MEGEDVQGGNEDGWVKENGQGGSRRKYHGDVSKLKNIVPFTFEKITSVNCFNASKENTIIVLPW